MCKATAPYSVISTPLAFRASANTWALARLVIIEAVATCSQYFKPSEPRALYTVAMSMTSLSTLLNSIEVR